ncbi:hypothetical protein SAMN05421788_108121 [Filimonas lacunae]|uniref:FAS1 domain-containing protein n=1 Tax=Filimonas lacunae TaxID=477680 RepID=A0A173MDU4_9BACT|nr:hypothetical protein [Filimonas lacunae]BAV05735.1 hypothetical protein FLA_1747 [Filimonas lacunae]SIT28757.1 hypothetical protein SAMN05421788_108121 [Filimonas lacunae]
MRITRLYSLLFACMVICCGTGCKKDAYKDDGGKAVAEVNMTTYDYLKSKPQFSSLIHLIDKAGLQEKLNSNITFFAVTNYGVDDWVSAKKQQRIIQLNDENITFTIDSIPVSYYKDSLLTYMFAGKITRDSLTTRGKIYNNLLGPVSADTTYLIKLHRFTDVYSNYLDYIEYVNFTLVIGSRDDLAADPDAIPESQKDISSDCQTSGIITTTGILHVLDGYHRLFFNGEPLSGN